MSVAVIAFGLAPSVEPLFLLFKKVIDLFYQFQHFVRILFYSGLLAQKIPAFLLGSLHQFTCSFVCGCWEGRSIVNDSKIESLYDTVPTQDG